MTPAIAPMMTALRGVPLAFTRAQCRAPGTAPSRLNANSMREVEVMQAVVQKNCPAMRCDDDLEQPELRAQLPGRRCAATRPQAVEDRRVVTSVVAAKRKDSSRIQPPMAE